MQKSKLLLEPKQKTNSEEEEENKFKNISKTELEANLLQNIRNPESWKLLTKSELQYSPKILGAKKHKP